MTRQQQKDFVRGLSETIYNDIIRQIDADKIPSDWDDHELRCLLSERHSQFAAMSILKNKPHSRRARAYRNVVMTGSL